MEQAKQWIVFALALSLCGGVELLAGCARSAEPTQGRGLPPEAGVYQATFSVTDFNVGMREVPSLLGDLVLEKNGTYRFTRSDIKGTWRYDVATNQVNFTGPLEQASPRYQASNGFYVFLFSFKTPTGGSEVKASKKSSKPFPNLTVVNGGFKGNLLCENRYNSIAFIDLAQGTFSGSFNGRKPHRARNGEIVFLDESANANRPSVVIASATGQTISTIKGELEGALGDDGAQTSRIARPALSDDASKIAIGGRRFTVNRSTGVSRSVDCLHILARDGRRVAAIDDVNIEQRPAWLADGRLAFVGKDGSLNVVDGEGENRQRIVGEQVSSPSASRDNRLAYVRGQSVWVVNSDGAGARQATSVDQPIDEVCWSPDGKALALSVKYFSGFQVWIAPLDGNAPLALTDARGTRLDVNGGSLQWN